jgi:hypothetical protein
MNINNMEYVAVTLTCPLLSKPKDLMLPLDIPQYILVDRLINSLDIKSPDQTRGFLLINDFEDRIEKKTTLFLQGTLRNGNIKFGQVLTLEFREIKSKLSLQCLDGPEFDINSNEAIIGAQRGLDIDLSGIPNQEYVSRRHARIVSKNGNYYIVDTQSANGTKINNTLLPKNSEQMISDGDVILLGLSQEMGIVLIAKLRK